MSEARGRARAQNKDAGALVGETKLRVGVVFAQLYRDAPHTGVRGELPGLLSGHRAGDRSSQPLQLDKRDVASTLPGHCVKPASRKQPGAYQTDISPVTRQETCRYATNIRPTPGRRTAAALRADESEARAQGR